MTDDARRQARTFASIILSDNTERSVEEQAMMHQSAEDLYYRQLRLKLRTEFAGMWTLREVQDDYSA